MTDKLSGCVDVQVNGYGGVDFNANDLTAEELDRACRLLSEHGNDFFCPTVITAGISLMCRRLRRIVKLREASPLAKRMIVGLHIEGPFINEQPGFVGAHPKSAVIPANWDDMQRLLEACDGLARIVTLAPERDENAQVTSRLAAAGIVVSAGHCGPDRETLVRFIDAGLRMFTHLGNGCPLLIPRHDNIIQNVLSLADRLWIAFIADGAHIPLHVLKNYLKSAEDRAIVVTDAITAAGLGPGRYSLGDQVVDVDEQGITRLPEQPDSPYLAGSVTTMPLTCNNLSRIELGVDRIRQLVCENPRRLLGLA